MNDFPDQELLDELYEQDKQLWEEEGERFESIKELAHYCPLCGVRAGEPDFEPDDPSVGIFHWLFINWCDKCQTNFYTYDDGVREAD